MFVTGRCVEDAVVSVRPTSSMLLVSDITDGLPDEVAGAVGDVVVVVVVVQDDAGAGAHAGYDGWKAAAGEAA